jgi:GAF domain-containing protein
VDRHDGEARPVGEPGAWATARAAVAVAVADPSLSGLPAALQRVCRAAGSSLSLAGAVVQLVTGAREPVVLASSDESSRRIGNVAFEVGQGPCFDAFTLARPVLVPDLMGEGQARWPGYVSAVSESGVAATYTVPLHVGAERLGVLELYGSEVRSLTLDEISVALVFAEAATDSMIDPPASASVALLEEREARGMDHRLEIHQAQGMVTVDLGIGMAEALSLMRAHAFGRELALIEIAQEILAGARLALPGEA